MRPPSCFTQGFGTPLTSSLFFWPGTTMWSRPSRSVKINRPSGRNSRPQGVRRSSTTVSSLKACRSLSKTRPISTLGAGWATSRAAPACSRMKTTSDAIWLSVRAPLKGGMPALNCPSPMLAARLASAPPKVQVSSSKLPARSPARFAPWQVAQSC